MIHVVATIQLQPGTRDRFLAEFARLVPDVRAEAGCIEYGGGVDLTTSVAGQAAVRPDVVVVVEKWSDLAALGRHLDAPHMTAYRARVSDWVVSVSLQILAPAGEPHSAPTPSPA